MLANISPSLESLQPRCEETTSKQILEHTLHHPGFAAGSLLSALLRGPVGPTTSTPIIVAIAAITHGRGLLLFRLDELGAPFEPELMAW